MRAKMHAQLALCHAKQICMQLQVWETVSNTLLTGRWLLRADLVHESQQVFDSGVSISSRLAGCQPLGLCLQRSCHSTQLICQIEA